MKRFLSGILILFVLFWSTNPERQTNHSQAIDGHFLTAVDQSAVVPDLVERSAKQAASFVENIFCESAALHLAAATAWSPIPGSLLVSRYLRDPFYTNITIHAP